ncbi:hypothetical protein QTP88_024214 [Uroleucon formosanum]
MNLNFKNYFSIILMAIVYSDYEFIYVDIGAYGKDCDSAVFKETVFWKLLETNKLDIPHAETVITNLNLPYVLVGDEAFALSTNLLRPYRGKNLCIKIRVFNYCLTRARIYVECAFGILANKWRVFHRPLNISKEFAKDIVKACVVIMLLYYYSGFGNCLALIISSELDLFLISVGPATRRSLVTPEIFLYG